MSDLLVRAPKDPLVWESLLAAVQPPTFLQSWAWGETQRALGEDVIRLGAYEGEILCGVAQAVTVTARRGKFLHVPHGPIVSDTRQPTSPRLNRESRGTSEAGGSRETFNALLRALIGEARRRKCVFLRVSPIQEDTAEHRVWYRDLGFRTAPIHIHAERLWILDLASSEDELLAGMRKTTRNLIRRGEREGVTVRFLEPNDDLFPFFGLYEETAARERFVPFSPAAIRAELSSFSANQLTIQDKPFTFLPKTVNEEVGGSSAGGILVGLTEHRGEALAAAVVPLTSWSAFYHHGASSRRRPEVPAAYALQWALIREAKRRGCREYNFWGVSTLHPTPNTQHPWYGLTLFKTGFGGREVPLVPTQDLPLTPRYWLAYAIDRLRRQVRRLPREG